MRLIRDSDSYVLLHGHDCVRTICSSVEKYAVSGQDCIRGSECYLAIKAKVGVIIFLH